METTGKLGTAPADGGRTLARTVDNASVGAHEVIDKISDATRPAVDRVASGAQQAVDKIASAASQTAGTLRARSRRLWSTKTQTMEQCRGYVRENPMTSLGVAVAAGFLLSRLWKSR
jgi:ElaB/YqjD/DUF883 family membrane-anchored ribosome-binding protein